MRKGCFSQALETLRDAVVMMRQVYYVGRQYNDAELEMAKHHVALAEHRLRKPLNEVGSAIIQTLFLQESEYACIESIVETISSFDQNFVAIHIDIIQIECENSYYDFESAVLLYNLALAHVGLANIHSIANENSAELLQAALKLFHYTHALIINEMSTSMECSLSSKFLGALVMGSFLAVLTMQGRKSEADFAAASLKDFVKAINARKTTSDNRGAAAA
jgi:hypothetical protein